MRKIMIGLLLAATAAAPALADKGGKGGGKHAAVQGGGKHGFAGNNGAGKQRGGGPKWSGSQGGGKEFKGRGGGFLIVERAPQRWHAQPVRQQRLERPERWERPVRVVRMDSKQARKAWKREVKEERRFARAVAQQERVRPERWVRAPQPVYDRPVYRETVRYVAPATRHLPVYRQPSYAAYAPIAYAAPWRAESGWWPSSSWDDGYWAGDYTPLYAGSYGYDDYDGYWPASYGPYETGYQSYGLGLFGGGGGGVLSALLPVIIQSLFGGETGGLGSLAGLGGLGGLNTITGTDELDVLPLQQASYVDPYGEGDLTSMLLPALLSQNSLF